VFPLKQLLPVKTVALGDTERVMIPSQLLQEFHCSLKTSAIQLRLTKKPKTLSGKDAFLLDLILTNAAATRNVFTLMEKN
jgi:hypothetical protein